MRVAVVCDGMPAKVRIIRSQVDLFARYWIKQSEAGHLVLMRDDYPAAQGSLADIMLNPNYRLAKSACDPQR